MLLWPKKVLIYTDGASRGNPGPCSFGLAVFSEDKKLKASSVSGLTSFSKNKELMIYEEYSYLEDSNTNNFAEYKAVIRALELSVQNKIQELYLFSDSQFLIRQLEKKYKIKSPNIKPLFKQCQELLKKIPKTHFHHIPREQNKLTDSLANKALDERENF